MIPFRILCLLTLSAFVFVGCDSGENGDTIDRVTITSVEINEFPEEEPGGGDWDGGLTPNPDIYYILYDDDTGSELDNADGDNFSDVDNGDLPLIWDGDYTSRDLDRPLAIELYDEDPTNEDDFMGSTDVFRLNDAFDRPTLIVTGPEISILLRLEWD